MNSGQTLWQTFWEGGNGTGERVLVFLLGTLPPRSWETEEGIQPSGPYEKAISKQWQSSSDVLWKSNLICSVSRSDPVRCPGITGGPPRRSDCRTAETIEIALHFSVSILCCNVIVYIPTYLNIGSINVGIVKS